MWSSFTRLSWRRLDRAAWTTSAASAVWVAFSHKQLESSSSSSSHNSNNNNGNKTIFLSTTTTTACESDQEERRIRKRATLQQAGARTDLTWKLQRMGTTEALSALRQQQTQLLEKWQQDEEGWSQLPARAWPAYQPNPEQLAGIEQQLTDNHCNDNLNSETNLCQKLKFHRATSLVFYNIDPKQGFEIYQEMANQGHIDSMVACGVILTEGLGGLRDREEEGVAWLQKALAVEKIEEEQINVQASYELGTVYYTGIDGVIEENPQKAFELFAQAAKQGHVGAMYMMADCLLEGEGTEISVARAIPLLYQAADQGHRFARQRLRELINDLRYQQQQKQQQNQQVHSS